MTGRGNFISIQTGSQRDPEKLADLAEKENN